MTLTTSSVFLKTFDTFWLFGPVLQQFSLVQTRIYWSEFNSQVCWKERFLIFFIFCEFCMICFLSCHETAPTMMPKEIHCKQTWTLVMYKSLTLEAFVTNPAQQLPLRNLWKGDHSRVINCPARSAILPVQVQMHVLSSEILLVHQAYSLDILLVQKRI